MTRSSEASNTIGVSQEKLSHETLIPAIQSRITKIATMVAPSDEQIAKGFNYACAFDEIPEVESGSIGFYYGGKDSKGEMLELWRFYGVPDESNIEEFKEGTGREACQRISLSWSESNTNRKDENIAKFTEWDELKPYDIDHIKVLQDSSDALAHIDKLIAQFETVITSENIPTT